MDDQNTQFNCYFQNFVGIFENAYSKEFCERIITQYEYMIKAGYGMSRVQNGNLKTDVDDMQIFSNDHCEMPLASITNEFNSKFWGLYYPLYEEEYAILRDSGRHSTYSFKIQKTKVGGGYHSWHYESGNRDNCIRLLTWILYLNDIEDGGETEFLYQHMRVKPKQGTLIMWPAAFTHTHRGNPPLKEDKYIVTGWTEF